MGVVIHVLDRRTVWLDVGGTQHEIGTLRHLSKVTELDEARAAEIQKASSLIPTTPAVLLAQILDLPLAASPETTVKSHLVIGWDEGRGSVSDLGWDYLPVLGYAVRDAQNESFVLHELRDGALSLVNAERAGELGLVSDGTLVRRGQPKVAKCSAVRAFSSGFAEADCVLGDGRTDRLLIKIIGDELPPPSWLVGRRPMDAERYPGNRTPPDTRAQPDMPTLPHV